MKKTIISIASAAHVFLLAMGISYAHQSIIAQKVSQAPLIDGKADDAAWSRAQAITTHDNQADLDITLKAVYTEKEIFFLVTFPDMDENRSHRSWVWDSGKKEYKQGNDREDIFILKWNMETYPVDLSIHADNPYLADIWFWKACRTDPMGYADDKSQRLSPHPADRAKTTISKSGKKMYLQRLGDEGDSTYKTNIYIEYKGDTIPRYSMQQPSLSRADIRAKGLWKAGQWTIEFGRALVTGHADDIQFHPEKVYQFGVSRREINDREDKPGVTNPYSGGDTSENLSLKFSR
jgi:hypothetical protein